MVPIDWIHDRARPILTPGSFPSRPEAFVPELSPTLVAWLAPLADLPALLREKGGDLQTLAFVAALPLLALLERVWPRRRGRLERIRRWPTNLGLTALNVVALGFVPLSFLGAALWAETQGLGLLNQVALPTALVVPGALLVRGFISTGTHWLNHKVPWLWRIHRVHHLDTELDVTSTVRFHPAEFFVNPLFGVPVVVAFGLPVWVLALYELLDVTVTLFSHANLRIPPRLNRWLRYLIVTPDLHRIHHSTWPPETDSNFGAVFPVWDLVIGTFRAEPRTPHETMPLGLAELQPGSAAVLRAEPAALRALIRDHPAETGHPACLWLPVPAPAPAGVITERAVAALAAVALSAWPRWYGRRLPAPANASPGALAALEAELARACPADGAAEGASWSRFWLYGILPVARAGGSADHLRSAFGRYLAEAVFWTPAALLPGKHVTWRAIGDDAARVTVAWNGLEQSVDLHVDAEGRPVRVEFRRWSDANPDQSFRFQPFGGYLSEFEEFEGFRLPTRVEAGNFFGTDDYFPFFRVNVTSVRFPGLEARRE